MFVEYEEAKEILKNIKKEDIKAIECKSVFYTEHVQKEEESDLLTVKELIHLQDGRIVPNLRFIKDYQRPFWLVKDHLKTYKDKREWIDLNDVIEYKSTQIRLCKSICHHRGWGDPRQRLQVIARDQYLFGCDIKTPALIKRGYQKRWPDLFTPNRICALDSETDMLGIEGDRVPIMLSITMKEKAYFGYVNRINKKVPDYAAKLRKRFDEVVQQDPDVAKRNIKLEIEGFDTPGQMCAAIIARLHIWQPDLVAIFNIDFDIDVMIKALERDHYYLPDVFCDPRVPPEYRYFKYRRDNPVKMKSNGKPFNKDWYDMWNYVDAPAGFFWVDTACVYRYIRMAQGKEASYSFNYILNKNIGESKLYLESEGVTAPDSTAAWHMQMQEHALVDYGVYNLYDDIRLEQLDEKTLDLCNQISLLSGYSDYQIFNSTPKKTSDKLHFYCLEETNEVIGSVSDQMVDELDRYVIEKEGYIKTLPAYSVTANGLELFKDTIPNLLSLIYRYVSDADIASTYPNGQIILNLSKDTTILEMCKIRGISNDEQILLGVNLTGGKVNSMEIMTTVGKLPTFRDMLDIYDQAV